MLCKLQNKKAPWQVSYDILLFKSRINEFVSDRHLSKIFKQNLKGNSTTPLFQHFLCLFLKIIVHLTQKSSASIKTNYL